MRGGGGERYRDRPGSALRPEAMAMTLKNIFHVRSAAQDRSVREITYTLEATRPRNFRKYFQLFPHRWYVPCEPGFPTLRKPYVRFVISIVPFTGTQTLIHEKSVFSMGCDARSHATLRWVHFRLCTCRFPMCTRPPLSVQWQIALRNGRGFWYSNGRLIRWLL